MALCSRFARACALFSFVLVANGLAFRTRQLMASFDDITTSLHHATNIPQPYTGLKWTNFVVSSPRNSSISSTDGIAAASPPSYALAGSKRYEYSELPNISRSQVNPIAFFDLQRFSWGCLAFENSTRLLVQPETARNCTLLVSCYELDHEKFNPRASAQSSEIGNSDAEPSKTAAYFFQVLPSARTWGVHMRTVRLEGRFNGCQRIIFDAQPFAEEKERTVALVLDDVMLRTYHVTEWDWSGFGQLVHQGSPFGVA